MKAKPIFILMLLFGLLSCGKNNSNPVTDQQSILTGNSTNSVVFTKWKITALSIGGIPQTLTASQISYQKQYSTDGAFSDTDGLKGTWSIPVADSLIEIYTNFSSNVPVRQGYNILHLDNSSMILTYNVNTINVTTTYTAIH